MELITARQFLALGDSEEFRKACFKANIEPTVRQVRKWRNKRGKAWNARNQKAETEG